MKAKAMKFEDYFVIDSYTNLKHVKLHLNCKMLTETNLLNLKQLNPLCSSPWKRPIFTINISPMRESPQT